MTMKVSNLMVGCLVGSLAVVTCASAGTARATPSPAAGASVAAEVDGRLLAVDALSNAEAWAVGYAGVQPIAMHWDGSTWVTVTVPLPAGTTFAKLRGVAVIALDDVWAAGEYWVNHRVRALLEHWDGDAWTIVPGAAAGTGPGLEDVSASGPEDVWAVGFHYPGGGIIRPLIEHWDGTSWTLVDEPRPPRFGAGDLSSVTVVSPTDAWAAGRTIRQDDQDDTLLAHWDGTGWTRTHVPGKRGYFTGLNGVDVAGNAGRAVGQSYYAKLMLTHRDGVEWVRDSVPAGAGRDPDAWDVSASSPTDAWVVGDSYRGTPQRPLALHWDGAAWSSVPCPSVPGSRLHYLWSVSAVDAGDAWAVGEYAHHGDPFVLLEHWDGATWSRWTGPGSTAG